MSVAKGFVPTSEVLRTAKSKSCAPSKAGLVLHFSRMPNALNSPVKYLVDFPLNDKEPF